jgi:phosphatidylglycerol lysyltransferase
VPASGERERALRLVLHHGFEATALQTLESGYQYFFFVDDLGAEAFLAYVDTGNGWVTAGSPIGADSARAGAVDAFLLAAREAGKRACFFGCERAPHGANGASMRAIFIGEQPVWDPRAWPEVLRRQRSLREQLRRARAKGVGVRELSQTELTEPSLRVAVQQVADRWLSRRALAPMGFLVRVEPFSLPAQRRYFVAEWKGRVIGFAAVLPVPAREGWFIENLVREPDAPNGTSELLVHAVMSYAASVPSDWLTLGLAPLSGTPSGFLRHIPRWTRGLYDFEGLRAYKCKFRPNSWLPVYLCHPPTQSMWRSIVDALAAFTDGGFVRFAWRTLLRGPTIVLRALAWLLVPWTIGLAFLPGDRWFMASWVRWAWVLFDATLALGLFTLLRKPRAQLLTALAVAVSVDATYTTLKVLLWNVPRVVRPSDYLVLFAACAAPALAAVVLWGARRHRLRFLPFG